MKLKLFILSIFCAVAVSAPVAIEAQAVRSQSSLYASTEGFTKLKQLLNSCTAQMKAAASADDVCNVMYLYTKGFISMSGEYKDLTDYQKKQIDVLTKQFGTQSQAKISKYNCKKKADAATLKGTTEAISEMQQKKK